MNIMNRLTWKSMWENRTRTIVTVVGVILSAAMFTAVTTLGFSLWSFLVADTVYSFGDYFLRYDYTSQSHLEELEQDKRISELGDLGILGYVTLTLDREDSSVLQEICAVAAGDKAFFNMKNVVLEEGRLPESSSEIVISRNVYHYLQQSGKPCEVGETVELQVVPEYEGASIALPADGKAFTKTYTIVGIAGLFTRLDDSVLHMSHLFTCADGAEGDALWHRAFVKTFLPADIQTMQKELPEGVKVYLNQSLLGFYGVSQYNNWNIVIGGICGVLIAIVMVGSVSLIYNAFSISVSERTKQFGLLSSIGATKKQLRRSVYFEALALSAMGIPLGILCGYGGIAVTLEILKAVVDTPLSAANGTVTLHAVPSGLMFLTAGAVALVTILLSARTPARRATKVSPLSAIRQTQDYQIPKRDIKAGKLSRKLWGLPGLMAKKYYAVSKKKYRTTVISLTVSILLFISATSIVQAVQSMADSSVNTNSFDMRCYNLTQEQIDDLRAQDSVDRSALFGMQYYITVIPAEDQAKDYLEVYDSSSKYSDHYSREVKELNIYYLEDAVLRAYLEERGIDPEPYFQENCPTALVYQPETTVYKEDPETGAMTRYVYKTGLLAEGVETLQLYPDTCPKEVREYVEGILGECIYMQAPAEDIPVYAFAPSQLPAGGSGIITPPTLQDGAVCVAVVAEKDEVGVPVFAYYLYDAENGTLEDTPIYTMAQSEDIPVFKVGAMIDESPFGLNFNYMADIGMVEVILPLSAAAGIPKTLAIAINDYDAITAYLTEEEVLYDDYLASEKQSRDMILMINVFSYGFISLISLICVANVFNTISTNIALRRREFGMLRSVGMKTGELYRMMSYECLSYGLKALFWGLSMGLLASFGIYQITSGAISEPYMPPWSAIVIAVTCVFMIVFITMFYAVTKLRKDNPIDAIRMENT